MAKEPVDHWDTHRDTQGIVRDFIYQLLNLLRNIF